MVGVSCTEVTTATLSCTKDVSGGAGSHFLALKLCVVGRCCNGAALGRVQRRPTPCGGEQAGGIIGAVVVGGLALRLCVMKQVFPVRRWLGDYCIGVVGVGTCA